MVQDVGMGMEAALQEIAQARDVDILIIEPIRHFS